MDDFGFVPQQANDDFGFQADEADASFGFVPEQPKAKLPRKNENYGNEDRRTKQPDESSTEAAGRKSSGLIQAGLGMVAGVPSTIAGGIYGLGALTSGQGIDEAVRRLHAAQESNFGLGEFKPWTTTGQHYSETAGAALNKPVEMVQQGTEDLTGSPAAGAIAGGVMAAGMQFVDPFLGIKGMKVGAVKLSKMGEKPSSVVGKSVDDIIASKQASIQSGDLFPKELAQEQEFQKNFQGPPRVEVRGTSADVLPMEGAGPINLREGRQQQLQLDHPETLQVTREGVALPESQAEPALQARNMQMDQMREQLDAEHAANQPAPSPTMLVDREGNVGPAGTMERATIAPEDPHVIQLAQQRAQETQAAHLEQQRLAEQSARMEGATQEELRPTENQLNLFGDNVTQGPIPETPFNTATRKQGGAVSEDAVDIVRTATGFVAKQGDKVVGRLESNMTPDQNRQLGHDSEYPAVVSTVGVDSSLKGQGVGKALYDAWRADHNDNVMPSGQTTADAWRYWKRNAPEKVDQFIKQEADRASMDPRALRSITDDTVRRQVAERMEQNTINAAADSYTPGQSFNARTRGQGGAIRFGSEKEPTLEQLKRIPGLKKDLAGFTTEPLRGDEFIAKYKDAADVEQNLAQRIANVGAKSMDYQAQKTLNPIIKAGAEELKGAQNRIAAAVRDIVHDGYAKLSRGLSKDEMIKAWDALEKQRIAKTYLTADELEQAGLSKKSREFVLNHRATMGEDGMLGRVNATLVSQGHNPITPEVAHTASKAVGDFRRVMYKTVDGEERVAGSLGSNSKLGLEYQTKQFMKHFPDTYPGPRSTHMTGHTGADINGMLEAINFLKSSDPIVAEFNERMQKLNDEALINNTGVATHLMQKKGVPGMPGNRPWESPYQNAKKGIEAQVAYITRVIKMSELAKANENLKPLLAKDNGLDMPKAKAYVQDKLDAALGQNPSRLAEGIQKTAAAIADATGIGSSAWAKLGTGTRQAINMKLLGLNSSFLLGNIMDPVKGMPGITQYLAQRGVKVSGTGLMFNARALVDAAKIDKGGAVDPIIKQAVKYAEDNHVYSSDLFEHSHEVRTTGLGEVQDALQWAPGKIEAGTRRNVFLALTRMLDERSSLTPKTGLFETAHKATDMVMNTYTTHDTPAAIQSMGALGKLPYNLMSYKANQLSKLAMFARDMKFSSPSTWKPMATELLAQTVLGGIKGVILYQEADFIVRHLSQMLGNPTSISKILFDNRNNTLVDLPMLPKVTVQDVAHGLPSAVTGVNMSNAMGIGNVVPDVSKPADVILPGVSALGQAVKSGFNFATDPSSKYNAMRAAVDILPGGNLLMGQLGKAVPGVGKPFFSRQTPNGELGETISSTKTGVDSVKGGVLRTPADIAAKAIGMTGVHEAEARQGAYEEGQIQKYYQDKRDAAMDKMVKGFLVSNTVDKSAIQDFVKAQGDPKKLPAEIDKMVNNQVLTQQQAMIIKQAAAKSIGGAEALKRMRSFH